MFVAKLDPQGGRRWGTYYGGPGDDAAGPGSVAGFGPADILLAGHATSHTDIATPGALFQPDFGGGEADAFLLHLSHGQGDACHADSECDSGFCVDGVCCDSACGGDSPDDCQACSVAAGGAQDGTCGLVADDTPCAGGLCLSGTCTPDDPTGTGTSTSDTDPNPTTPTGGVEGSGGAQTSGGSGDVPTGGGPGDDSSGAQSDGSSTGPTVDGGCGCRQSPAPRDLSLLAFLALLTRRRGRAGRTL